MTNTVKFILCIFLPVFVGAVSGFATIGDLSGWYSQLEKPSFNPPAQLFGPVWTTLYILMGISSFLILRSNANAIKERSGIIYFIQLALNFAWSFLFFSFHMIGIAFAEMIVLWFLILFMIITFYRINKTAALLQIPYLLWVSFAAILNFSILILNHS
jgi:translocator protein